MISLTINNIGKKFSREWIFRGLSYQFKIGEPVAVIGSNGSGKSTLVKALAGIIPLNQGVIDYQLNGKSLTEDAWHKHIGISAPYLELIEEFTLSESIDFHARFRSFIDGVDKKTFIEKLNLEKHKDKYIRDFSSGMKQKLKLGFSFFTENDVLILDEPTANIDQTGFEWYKEEVQKLIPRKILIISSNEPKEYTFCKEHISILDFKS